MQRIEKKQTHYIYYEENMRNIAKRVKKSVKIKFHELLPILTPTANMGMHWNSSYQILLEFQISTLTSASFHLSLSDQIWWHQLTCFCKLYFCHCCYFIPSYFWIFCFSLLIWVFFLWLFPPLKGNDATHSSELDLIAPVRMFWSFKFQPLLFKLCQYI